MAEVVIVGSAIIACLVLMLSILMLLLMPTHRRVIRSQREAIHSAEKLEATAGRVLNDLKGDQR